MAWLHTWSGLVVGWILFGMFVTGTVAFFRPETTRWMEPESRAPASFALAVAGAQRHLEQVAPTAPSWNITLPDDRESLTRVSWGPHAKSHGMGNPGSHGMGQPRCQMMSMRGAEVTLDAATGEPINPRKTCGGDFFYYVHFQLHYLPAIPGRWLAGLCAMFLLTAIVAGVITHKRIFQDFFTFRPKKAPQRSWLDAHNMTAVLALPFHVMITYTGLVALMALYMPWGVKANYEKPVTVYEVVSPPLDVPEPSRRLATLAPLEAVVGRAQQIWDGGRPGTVVVHNPGDANARIVVRRHAGDQLSYQGEALVFDGVNGQLVSRSAMKGPAAVTGHAMRGIHMGRFSGPPLRWLYFLSGLSGCAMVATGLVLWTVKRRGDLPDPDRPHFGFRLVERLNIGTIAGVPAGIGALLWANRLLPVSMASRSAWEMHFFFIAWGALILYACLRPTRRAWVETLSIASIVVAAAPIVSAFATPHRSLLRNLVAGDVAMVAFDLTLFALAAMLAFIAFRTHVYKPTVKAKARRQKPEAEMAVA